jgi:hypothetical protein
LNLNYLSDFTASSTISTILPSGSALTGNHSQAALNKYVNKNIIVVMASVQDSLGSITNLTSIFIINPNDFLSASQFSLLWQISNYSTVAEASFLNLIASKLVSMSTVPPINTDDAE